MCSSSIEVLTDNATDTLHDGVNHLLANSVVTTGVVVGTSCESSISYAPFNSLM